MPVNDSETEALLNAAGAGSLDARHKLLDRHRDQLTRMVSVRLDRRLAPRLDASDVVSQAMVVADRNLDAYLASQPLPFYLWMRQFAWERVVQVHRHHLAQRRSVAREVSSEEALPDGSAARLADILADSGTSPSQNAVRAETRQLVRELLSKLASRDREVLVMYYLEQLSIVDIAAALGLSEGAVKMRHLRALERVRKLVMRDEEGTG